MRTFSACDFGCWEAQEDVCRCICGGKNHGIMVRGDKASIPTGLKRQMKKLSGIYELVAVGDYFSTYWDGDFGKIKRETREKEGNIDFIVKRASKQQAEKWPEVMAITQRSGEGVAMGNRIPYLLWKLVITKEQFLASMEVKP